MTQPTQRQPVPESLGPGVEDASGTVRYGVAAPGRVVITQQRDPDERAADWAAARERGGCVRCQALPDALVQALGAALQAAREEGRRSR